MMRCCGRHTQIAVRYISLEHQAVWDLVHAQATHGLVLLCLHGTAMRTLWCTCTWAAGASAIHAKGSEPEATAAVAVAELAEGLSSGSCVDQWLQDQVR